MEVDARNAALGPQAGKFRHEHMLTWPLASCYRSITLNSTLRFSARFSSSVLGTKGWRLP